MRRIIPRGVLLLAVALAAASLTPAALANTQETIGHAGGVAAQQQQNHCADGSHTCINALYQWPRCDPTYVNQRGVAQWACHGYLARWYYDTFVPRGEVWWATTTIDPYGKVLSYSQGRAWICQGPC